ncbi:MAG: hypothetical protein P1U36_08480 [Legionellaceae bacterium]|nr:hypothetical protein [Legionellaceae bacterium]
MPMFFESNTQESFDIAQIALRHTQEVVRFSSNQECNMDGELQRQCEQRLNQMRLIPIEADEYSSEWITEIAELAKTHSVGNCCEKSCVAFNFLNTHPSLSQVNIELFNNPFSDHFFVVVGRHEDTPVHDPSQWNKDAVICDPWGESSCYKISSVPFDRLEQNKFEAMDDLRYLNKVETKALVLHQFIIGDNDDLERQECLVLRARSYQGVFHSYNHHVPMCYEAWDYPDEELGSELSLRRS